MIPILLVLTAFFRPAAPTVGDPITIQFPQTAVLDRSPDYEIVSQRGNTVVIRTFEPHPFAIHGRAGNVVFRNMIVPVRSVLKRGDNMTPAPLKPPRREPYPRLPFVLIAAAALAAVAVWSAVILRSRVRIEPVVPLLPPAEQFRAAVIALRDDPRLPRRWARLADALREYLAATSQLGRELTTSEVVVRVRVGPPPLAAAESGGPALIAEILRQGDLEKFSPWGPAQADFESIANRAIELVPEPAIEVAA